MNGSERRLVVNADDFGRTEGVNDGVIRAHVQGIVTSASLMVRWPASSGAAERAGVHSALGLGLHVDLAEWERVGAGWQARYEVVDAADEEAVGREIESQLDRFVELVGRSPTHLDSHQHVHRRKPVRRRLARLGRRLGVGVRQVTDHARYEGSFHGRDGDGSPLPHSISVHGLVEIIDGLPEGLTELACHPASTVGPELEGYGPERLTELETLCDPAVADAVRRGHVQLVSHADAG